MEAIFPPEQPAGILNGVLLEELEKIALSHSDTEYAKLMQQKKVQLFRSFSKPGILT